MGMVCEAPARAATATATGDALVAAPTPPLDTGDTAQAVVAVESDVAGTHTKAETSEEKERRLRSNSEETALILTSMMSMGAFATAKASATPTPTPTAPRTASTSHDSDDDDDMGEDLSGDEHDQNGDYRDGGKGKGRVHQVHFEGPHGSKLDFTDDAGFNHRFRNESNRVKSLVTKHISIDELREHFDRPIIDVAKDFGICITLMKKICRRNGIKRWPHRQIRSLSKSIASMEAAMLSAQGTERDKYYDQIVSLKLKRDAVIADPNKENAMMVGRPKTPTKENGSLRPHAHIHAAPKMSPRSGSPSVASVASATAVAGVAMVGGSQGRTTDGPGTPHSKGGRWTGEEHAAFLHGIRLYGKDWRRVAQVVRTRSAVQTRTHAQKYLLKFAGRFPFDAESLELKDQPTGAASSSHNNEGDAKEMDISTASMSNNSHEEERQQPVAKDAHETSEMAAVTKSALEAMAMILNSPQFGSYRDLAPSPLKIEPQVHQQPQQQQQPALTLSPYTENANENEMEPDAEMEVETQSPMDDVVMESPRSVNSAALPLLPSVVIKPSAVVVVGTPLSASTTTINDQQIAIAP